MPEVKKAELIEGVVYLELPSEADRAGLIGGTVYMASPVRITQHGIPDGIIQFWLGFYSAATPGVEHATNSTIHLGPEDVPQPDALLHLLPEAGGHAFVDEDGYLGSARIGC